MSLPDLIRQVFFYCVICVVGFIWWVGFFYLLDRAIG